jgi:hypothetical protein
MTRGSSGTWMRVAVTGATGFIGRHVLRRLATESEVEIVALRRKGSHFFPELDFVEWVEVDMAELRPDTLEVLLSHLDTPVLHLRKRTESDIVGRTKDTRRCAVRYVRGRATEGLRAGGGDGPLSRRTSPPAGRPQNCEYLFGSSPINSTSRRTMGGRDAFRNSSRSGALAYPSHEPMAFRGDNQKLKATFAQHSEIDDE